MAEKQRTISVRKSDTKIGTFKLGFFMVIAYFLQRMDVIYHVDDNTIPPRKRCDKSRLPHGLIAFVFCLYLFDMTLNSHPIYRVEEWVKKHPFLRLLFPSVSPDYFTEDRIARTLDAIGEKVVDVSIAQSTYLVEVFKISLAVVYVDLTNFTVAGDYENQDLGSVIMGYAPCPKSGKRNKKAVSKISLTSDDGGVPFYSETLKGSEPDTVCYLPAIDAFRKIIGSQSLNDTIFVGDSKSMTVKTQTIIDSDGGKFIGMKYKTDDKAIKTALAQLKESGRLSTSEIMETTESQIGEELIEIDVEYLQKNIDNPELHELMSTSHGKKKTRYSGNDIEHSYIGTDDKEHYLREILICSSEKQRSDLLKIERGLETSEEALEKIKKGARGSRYKNKEAVMYAANKVLTSNSCQSLYSVDVTEEIEIIKKATKRGRHSENTQFVEIEKVRYNLTYSQNAEAIENKKELCGFFILQTNLTGREADNRRILQLYKGQDKVEKTFATDKNVLHVTPLWLKSTRRIKGLLYCYAILSQVVTLIDREIVINMKRQKIQTLAGIIPDKDIVRPHTPIFRSLFEDIQCCIEESSDGNISIEVHGMSELPALLTKLAGVDPAYYSDNAIAEKLSVWAQDYPEDFENSLRLTLHDPNAPENQSVNS